MKVEQGFMIEKLAQFMCGRCRTVHCFMCSPKRCASYQGAKKLVLKSKNIDDLRKGLKEMVGEEA